MLKKIKDWIDNGCPLLPKQFKQSRQRYQYDLNQQTQQRIRTLADNHKKDLEEVRSTIKEIVDNSVRIRWDKGHLPSTYRIALDFNADLMSYCGDTRLARQELAYHVSRQIEAEIVSSKFVRDAHDNELRQEHERPTLRAFDPSDEYSR